MRVNNASSGSAKSATEHFSFGHKAIAVALSAVLLGFGWPAVSPAGGYAEVGGGQAEAVASDASGEAGDSNDSAGSAQGSEEESTGSTQANNVQADNEEEGAGSAQAYDEEDSGLAGQDESVQSGEEQPASILGSQNELSRVSNERTVEVDGTCFFWAAVRAYSSWESSNDGIATVKGYDSWGAIGADVTGVKPGRVKIYQYYWKQGQRRSVVYSFRVVTAPIENHVTLTGTTVSAVYDGKAHTAGAATVTGNHDHPVVIEYQIPGTDSWTTNPAEITATNVADSTTVNVRASVPSYYEGYVETTETLAINQCPVTLTSESQELTYNGQPQKWEHAGVTSGAFAEGEGVASYSFSNSVTNAGDRAYNAFTYTLNGKTNADNYKIETSYGMITVKPVTDEVIVKVAGHKASATYDGDEHAVSGYDISTESGIYNVGTAVKFSGTAEAAGTDADTYRMGLSVDQFENTDDNFSNVTFVVEDGEVAIAPAPYTVVTNSAEKVYDSKPLTAGGKIEGIVKGEDAGFEITGVQTEVGTSSNTYVVKWNKSAKRSNYELKGESLGTLKVTEAAAPAAEGNSSASGNNGTDVSDKGSSATKAGSTAKTGDAVTPFAAGAGIVAMAAALAAFFVSRKRRGIERQ